MDAEAYNKSYAGGKWWVDQCGWGRRFDNEKDADHHIEVMLEKALTRRKKSGRLVSRGRRRKLEVPLDSQMSMC